MSALSRESLDRAFAILEAAALAGERCPITAGPAAHPILKSVQIHALAHGGRIRIEISGANFRRVILMSGEHRGKATASNPDPRGCKAWKVVDSAGTRVNGKLQDLGARSRPQPSGLLPCTGKGR